MSISPHEQPVREEPTVGSPVQQPAPRFGLLANGSSPRWDVAVDESLEQEGEWLLEIDGSTVYLVFQIHELGVIPAAIDFLQRHLSRPAGTEQPAWSEQEDVSILGTFGHGEVSLLWDDEGVGRCFILVQPEHGGAIRLCLQRDDIEMLLQALRQVAADLPKEAE